MESASRIGDGRGIRRLRYSLFNNTSFIVCCLLNLPQPLQFIRPIHARSSTTSEPYHKARNSQLLHKVPSPRTTQTACLNYLFSRSSRQLHSRPVPFTRIQLSRLHHTYPSFIHPPFNITTTPRAHPPPRLPQLQRPISARNVQYRKLRARLRFRWSTLPRRVLHHFRL